MDHVTPSSFIMNILKYIMAESVMAPFSAAILVVVVCSFSGVVVLFYFVSGLEAVKMR